jgi:hypothetical protein
VVVVTFPSLETTYRDVITIFPTLFQVASTVFESMRLRAMVSGPSGAPVPTHFEILSATLVHTKAVFMGKCGHTGRTQLSQVSHYRLAACPGGSPSTAQKGEVSQSLMEAVLTWLTAAVDRERQGINRSIPENSCELSH